MKRIALSLFAFACLAVPAAAFDIGAMSDNERAIFRSEIRDYLMENPEVLMEAIQVLEQRRAEQESLAEVQMLEDNRDAIFNDSWSYVDGNPDGDVVIVEFFDYRCGYCKRAFPAVNELLSSDGNIRLVLKEFPILGEQSTLAARYAIATKITSGDEAYKNVHDRLMLQGGDINEGFLARLSGQFSLDHDAIVAEMNGDEVNRIIGENHALAQKLKIQGTPSFVMGDNFVRGFVELEQMRTIVEAIRAKQG